MNLEKILSEMTLEEKVGQLFQIGFDGIVVTPEIKEMIENYRPGGIIYFRRNIQSPEQVASLSNRLQKLAINRDGGVPLMISTDQEGGIVTRLTGITHFPGNMTLGATKNLSLARMVGQTVAQELKTLGVNMNLAPVLDINNNPHNPVIGVRSFGENPLLVADLGVAFIEGMQDEAIISCAKHFPGHGDTATDSHLALPIVRHSRRRLKEIELYPFSQAIKAGIDSIMTAHISFPTIEPREKLPATLSFNVLTGLLREEMGYDGLIITDCMEMNAIVSTLGTAEGAVMTIEAGSDMVLISHTLDRQKASIEALVNAVQKGRIAEERINKSVLRILRLKEKRIGLKQLPLADYKKIDKNKGEELAYQVARQGVTLVKDEDNLIPISKVGDNKVMVLDFFTSEGSLVEDKWESENHLASYLLSQGMQVESFSFPKGSVELPSLDGIDQVIVCSYDAVNNPQQVEVLKKLRTLTKALIVVALRNPYDLTVFPEVGTYLTTYDFSLANLRVASEIITGKYKARGVLPITWKL